MTDEFFDMLKTGGVDGVLNKYPTIEDALEDARAEIARLNRVIRAMATWCGKLSCPPRATEGDSICKSYKTCADCFIDHFTKQVQEAKDVK